jgi:hypothetical protein
MPIIKLRMLTFRLILHIPIAFASMSALFCPKLGEKKLSVNALGVIMACSLLSYDLHSISSFDRILCLPNLLCTVVINLVNSLSLRIERNTATVAKAHYASFIAKCLLTFLVTCDPRSTASVECISNRKVKNNELSNDSYCSLC